MRPSVLTAFSVIDPFGMIMPFLTAFDPRTGGPPAGVTVAQGDLLDLTTQAPVDLLVVSAFPEDYTPTPTSLIGALDRRGISFEALARRKEEDLRANTWCWWSEPLSSTQQRAIGARRILCFEPPMDLALGEYLRALGVAITSSTLLLGTDSVAMPLLLTGDRRAELEDVLPEQLRAVAGAMRGRSSLARALIAVYQEDHVERAAPIVERFRLTLTELPSRKETQDVFVSYRHADRPSVDLFCDAMRREAPSATIWRDLQPLQTGSLWTHELAAAIDSVRLFVPFYSREYFKSVMCNEELAAAHIRRRTLGTEFILPILLDDVPLSSYLQVTQYRDVRSNPTEGITAAARLVLQRLVSGPDRLQPLTGTQL